MPPSIFSLFAEIFNPTVIKQCQSPLPPLLKDGNSQRPQTCKYRLSHFAAATITICKWSGVKETKQGAHQMQQEMGKERAKRGKSTEERAVKKSIAHSYMLMCEKGSRCRLKTKGCLVTRVYSITLVKP